MAIVRWEPLRELSTLQNEMNRLFGTVFDTPRRATAATLRRWMPAMDLVETEDHFVLRADLPGLAEEDVNIEVEDRVLTVSGERKAEHEESKEGYHRVERAFGSFSRSLTLPEGIDAEAVTAELRPRRARGPDPEARAAQAAQDLDRRRATRRRRDRAALEAPPRRGRGANVPPAPRVRPSAPRDPGSYARTGTLKLAHGEVRTPAFVPLATKAVVKTLEVREAGALGYDMVLGNTFHLFLTPGHELIAQLGGLHRFQRWDRPIITDSGGFQVFSMGHGTVADEIKGRAAQFAGERVGRDPRDRGGGRALPLLPRRLDASSWARRPRWRSRPRWARTSRSCSTSARRSTPTATTRRARPSARTAGSTAASTGTPSTAPRASSSTGSSRAATDEDLRRESGAGGRRPRRPGRDRDRRLARRGQGADVRGRRVDDRGAAGGPAAPPARDRRGRRPRARRRARHRHLRLRDADPDRPPRHGARARPGQALARRPGQGPLARGRRAAARGLPVPGLRRGLLARVPALPVQGQGADRDAPAHDPQPRLPAAPDGRAARRDRRGPPGRGGRRGAGGRRAVGAGLASRSRRFDAAWSGRLGHASGEAAARAR